MKKISTLDDLKKLWPEILKEIKEKSTALSTLLVNSKIKELNNNTVNIELPITNGYFTTTLEKSKKFIQNKIGERIHRDIKVEFIHLVKEDQKEDIIEKTMKIFDARIVQNRGNKNG